MTISTGLPGLDNLLPEEGYPLGETSFILGQVGSGKTSVACQAAVKALVLGKTVMWVDPGREFGKRLHRIEEHHDRLNGTFVYRDSSSTERVIHDIETIPADLIIVDGLQAITTTLSGVITKLRHEVPEKGAVVVTWQEHRSRTNTERDATYVWPKDLVPFTKVRAYNQRAYTPEGSIEIVFNGISCREVKRRTVWDRLRDDA